MAKLVGREKEFRNKRNYLLKESQANEDCLFVSNWGSKTVLRGGNYLGKYCKRMGGGFRIWGGRGKLKKLEQKNKRSLY